MPDRPGRTPGTGPRPRPGSCTPGRSAARSGCRRCRSGGPGAGSRWWSAGPAGARSAALHLDRLQDDVLDGTVVAAGGDLGDPVDDVAALLVGDLPEDRVPHVQVRRLAHRDEELRAVRPRPGVGHGQQVRTVELQLGVELVLELVAGAAVALPERVTALDHEAVDDPVEDRAVVEPIGGLLPRLRVRPLPAALGQVG